MNSTLRKLALVPIFLVLVVGGGLLMRGNTGSQASAAGKQDPPATGSSKGSDAAKAADRAIPRLLGDAIARRRRREGRAAIQQVADPLGQITVREASRIVSHAFAIKGIRPEKVIPFTSMEDGIERNIYLWTMPLKKDKSSR